MQRDFLQFQAMRLGVDVVKTARFGRLINNQKFVARVFSAPEQAIIADLLKAGAHQKCLAFAASRYAIKEALYKAFPGVKIPFLTLCALTSCTTQNTTPILVLGGQLEILIAQAGLTIQVSLAHESCCVVATVIAVPK